MTDPAPRKSDLGVRVVSAAVMVVVAGTALWLGGWPFTAFVSVIAFGVYWEWWGLVTKLSAASLARLLWLIGGAIYIGVAASVLVSIREEALRVTLLILLMVIAVDIGAYFAGRAIGGPKIAPKISPSKTWAGLGGGVVGAAVAYAAMMPWSYSGSHPRDTVTIVGFSLVSGAVVAVVAQTGDFFESWMKRRANVKDSGALIPGHGGLFDRVDGLLAVLILVGALPVIVGIMRAFGE